MKKKAVNLMGITLIACAVFALIILGVSLTQNLGSDGPGYWNKIIENKSAELTEAKITVCPNHSSHLNHPEYVTLSKTNAEDILSSLHSYDMEFEPYHGNTDDWKQCLCIILSAFDADEVKQIFLPIHLNADEASYLYIPYGQSFVRSKSPISYAHVLDLLEDTAADNNANALWQANLDAALNKEDLCSVTVTPLNMDSALDVIALESEELKELLHKLSLAKPGLHVTESLPLPEHEAYFKVVIKGSGIQEMTLYLHKYRTENMYLSASFGYATAPVNDGVVAVTEYLNAVTEAYTVNALLQEKWDGAHEACHVNCHYTVRAAGEEGGAGTEGEDIFLTDEQRECLSALFLDAEYKLSTVGDSLPLKDTGYLRFTLHKGQGTFEMTVCVQKDAEKSIYIIDYDGTVAEVVSADNTEQLINLYNSIKAHHDTTVWQRLWSETLNEQHGRRVTATTMQVMLDGVACGEKEIYTSEIDNLRSALSAAGVELMDEVDLSELPIDSYLKITLDCLDVDTSIEYELTVYVPVNSPGYVYLYNGETLVRSTVPINGSSVYRCYEVALCGDERDDTWEERLYKMVVSGERQVNYLCLNDYESELYRVKVEYYRIDNYLPSGLIAADKTQQFVDLFASFCLSFEETELPYPELRDGAIDIEFISNRFEQYSLKCRIAPDGYVYITLDDKMLRSTKAADYSAVCDFYYENRNIPNLLDGFLDYIFNPNYWLAEFLDPGYFGIENFCSAQINGTNIKPIEVVCADRVKYVCGYLSSSALAELENYVPSDYHLLYNGRQGVNGRLGIYLDMLLYRSSTSTYNDVTLHTFNEGDSIPERLGDGTLLFVFEVLEYEALGHTMWAFAEKDGQLADSYFIPAEKSYFTEYLGRKLLTRAQHIQRYYEYGIGFRSVTIPTTVIDGTEVILGHFKYDDCLSKNPKLEEIFAEAILYKDITDENGNTVCAFDYYKLRELLEVNYI